MSKLIHVVHVGDSIQAFNSLEEAEQYVSYLFCRFIKMPFTMPSEIKQPFETTKLMITIYNSIPNIKETFNYNFYQFNL